MNKLVLITGGSRGIGRESALYLAEKGCDVIITYHSNRDAADDVVSRIKEIGRSATALALDVSQTDTFSHFADVVETQLKSEFSRKELDVIIHNAGMGIYKSFEDTTESDFDILMKKNDDMLHETPFLLQFLRFVHHPNDKTGYFQQLMYHRDQN